MLRKSDLFRELYEGDVRVHFSVEFVLARFRHLCFGIFRSDCSNFQVQIYIYIKKYFVAIKSYNFFFFITFTFFAVRRKNKTEN